jgi:hypothetical protein
MVLSRDWPAFVGLGLVLVPCIAALIIVWWAVHGPGSDV